MSHHVLRSVQVTVLSLAALCGACGSDPNRTSSMPEGQAPATETPADTAGANSNAPPPGEQAPATPPTPAPESRTPSTQTNELAAPKSSSTPPASTVRLTENQVAMITDLANTSEIEQGKLAQGKAKSPAVKKFAAMMIKHHGEAKTEQAKLFKQLSLTPTQSQPATALKEDADRTLGALRAADGSAFDVAYMNSQVDAHQKVLDAINQELLPGASDQKLVEALNKMKKTVEAHLDEARSIQAELIKSKSGGSGDTL